MRFCWTIHPSDDPIDKVLELKKWVCECWWLGGLVKNIDHTVLVWINNGKWKIMCLQSPWCSVKKRLNSDLLEMWFFSNQGLFQQDWSSSWGFFFRLLTKQIWIIFRKMESNILAPCHLQMTGTIKQLWHLTRVSFFTREVSKLKLKFLWQGR